MPSPADKAAAFRALHERPGAFIIPNPWDAGTARLLAALGFEALASTSLGLANRFVAICGQDTFSVQKPDPEALLGTLRRAGGSLDRAVMVGDSLTDIATARAALMPVVAVDFGYTDRHVREFEPSRVISHFDELTVALCAGLIAASQG